MRWIYVILAFIILACNSSRPGNVEFNDTTKLCADESFNKDTVCGNIPTFNADGFRLSGEIMVKLSGVKSIPIQEMFKKLASIARLKFTPRKNLTIRLSVYHKTFESLSMDFIANSNGEYLSENAGKKIVDEQLVESFNATTDSAFDQEFIKILFSTIPSIPFKPK
ncbi:hypothetical protein [Flavitalea sp.]|nr:hypothetical protein [Flavitalea sp.]